MRYDYSQLAALAAVIREGSFDRAALTLHVTPSAVSQRLKLLEERVGRVLVVRGAPCVATEAGEVLYRHAQQVQLLEAELNSRLRAPDDGDDATPATLALAINADSLATWAMPAVAEFTAASGMLVELVVDDQEHTAEWLRSGRVLAAVTADAAPVQGCRVETLGTMRYRATASPAYCRRWFPDGVVPDALQRAPALLYNRKDRLEHRYLTERLGLPEQPLRAHWVPSSTAYLDATVAGMGWGMNPESMALPLLRAGQLEELLPEHPYDVALYWQYWRLGAESLRTLTQCMQKHAAAMLMPLQGGIAGRAGETT